MRCPFEGLIVAHAYPFEKSSFAGTFPASQCQHVVTAGLGHETGSLFLFDVPAPENVVQSLEPACDVGSASNAAAMPPYRFTTVPLASKMQPQSGGGFGATHRISAPWAGPSSNKPESTVGAGPTENAATMSAPVSAITIASAPRADCPPLPLSFPLLFIDSSPSQKGTLR